MRVQVAMLGQFWVAVNGAVVPVGAWRRERSLALVKLLALSAGHRLQKEQAMEALWPDMSPESSATNLRKAVHFARRALGEHKLIALDGDVVSLAPGNELIIDAEVFEEEAKTSLRSSDPSAHERAAELYGGDLLPEDRYVAWTDAPREHLRQLYVRVLRAGKLWERLLAVDPTDEEAQRALMQAALDAGNRGDVIRQFERLRERLRVDLGVGPAASTIAIYERALKGESVEPANITDRVRASLAWGIIHLHSGDFAKAEQIAREARELAMAAGLAREMGEASALFGLVAHMQGKWPEVFKSEFIEWIRNASTFTSTILDGHLCLAEFCLCGAGGHEQIANAARELLAIAEDADSAAGRALASLILGETELFSGDLDAAEQWLTKADALYEEVGSAAGRVLTIQRLAEVALARGQKWRVGRLLQKGFRIGQSNWLEPHLLLRLQSLAVESAGTLTKAISAITQGDRWLTERSMCQPCSMGFRVASSIALAEAGELDQANRRLDETERLAGMWNGGPWVAAVWEARGVQRQVKGNTEQASALFREAATRYLALGRRRDAERCLTRAAGVHEPRPNAVNT